MRDLRSAAGMPKEVLDEVQAIVEAMVKHYDDYKSAAKGAKGWIIDNQNMTWAMPYHDGAIAVWKAPRSVWLPSSFRTGINVNE